jgi:hypothetical protein
MIVEVVVVIAGKMTGNFESVECDITTFFEMASERGKRSEEGMQEKAVRRQEMLFQNP